MSMAGCCGCQRGAAAALRPDKAARDGRALRPRGFGQNAATCETEINEAAPSHNPGSGIIGKSTLLTLSRPFSLHQ